MCCLFGLIDYGNYSQVKNLSSTDKLVYKNNQVKATTDEEKLSYQGYLEDPSLPWNFKISYYFPINFIINYNLFYISITDFFY